MVTTAASFMKNIAREKNCTNKGTDKAIPKAIHKLKESDRRYTNKKNIHHATQGIE